MFGLGGWGVGIRIKGLGLGFWGVGLRVEGFWFGGPQVLAAK